MIKHWNTKVPNGYNLTNGGEGTCGYHHSNEVRKKISKIHKNKRLSDSAKEHLREIHKGKNNPIAKQVVQYSIDGQLIKIWDCIAEASEELKIANGNITSCCQKKRQSAGGYIWRYIDDKTPITYEETVKKKVVQYSKDGVFIKEFDSIAQVEKELGFFATNISRCCRGKLKTVKGYIWRYANDDINLN